MRDTHGAVRLVDVLSARSAAAIGIYLELFGINLDFVIVLNFGHYFDGRKRRMTSRVGVERRYAHQSVHALLRLEVSVRVVSVNLDSDALDTRLVARKIVEHLHLIALALGIAAVHAIEHARPVLRFGAARACVQCDNGIIGVVLALKQCLQSQRKRVVVQALELGVEFRLTLFVPVFFEQHYKRFAIGCAAGKSVISVQLAVHSGKFLVNFLRGGKVVPEIGLVLLVLQFRLATFKRIKVESCAKLCEHRIDLLEFILLLVYYYHNVSPLPSDISERDSLETSSFINLLSFSAITPTSKALSMVLTDILLLSAINKST